MELRKFIATTIREYLNEQEKTLDNVWYHGTDKKFNEKRTKVLHERYYFDSNKNLIRYIDEKGKIVVNGDKLQEKSIETKNEIVRLLKLRNTKK